MNPYLREWHHVGDVNRALRRARQVSGMTYRPNLQMLCAVDKCRNAPRWEMLVMGDVGHDRTFYICPPCRTDIIGDHEEAITAELMQHGEICRMKRQPTKRPPPFDKSALADAKRLIASAGVSAVVDDDGGVQLFVRDVIDPMALRSLPGDLHVPLTSAVERDIRHWNDAHLPHESNTKRDEAASRHRRRRHPNGREQNVYRSDYRVASWWWDQVVAVLPRALQELHDGVEPEREPEFVVTEFGADDLTKAGVL